MHKTLRISRVYTENGYNVMVEEAKQLGITVDVLFVRDDGWVLGASKGSAHRACLLCPNNWTHEIWLR